MKFEIWIESPIICFEATVLGVAASHNGKGYVRTQPQPHVVQPHHSCRDEIWASV
jgi:hypothetical protein